MDTIQNMIYLIMVLTGFAIMVMVIGVVVHIAGIGVSIVVDRIKARINRPR